MHSGVNWCVNSRVRREGRKQFLLVGPRFMFLPGCTADTKNRRSPAVVAFNLTCWSGDEWFVERWLYTFRLALTQDRLGGSGAATAT